MGSSHAGIAGWGNHLSAYWQIVALARLAGMHFSMEQGYVGPGFHSFWMTQLPKAIPAEACADTKSLTRACAEPGCLWAFPHTCRRAWPRILPLIRNVTHDAFRHWAESDAANFSMPEVLPGDVVIHDRCAKDSLLLHFQYGPIGFKFFECIPASTKRIFVNNAAQMDRKGVVFYPCMAVHAALLNFLARRYPHAQLIEAAQAVTPDSLHQDWARMIHAPMLLGSVSTFTLWAGIANVGQVVAPPMPWFAAEDRMAVEGYKPAAPAQMPALGKHWQWRPAAILYPRVAAAANIDLHATGKIITWLEEH